MKKILFSCFLLAVAFTSCKKDKPNNGTTDDSVDLLKDSVYMYAQEEYLWNDGLPAASTFNPRRFTGATTLATLQSEIDALSQIKVNPSTGRAYEYDASFPGTAKYSYIDEGQAATSIGGTGGDFGFALTYVAANDLRIRYVFGGSPAATQNLARGYKVVTVNDQPVAITTGGSSDPAILRINQALGSNSIKLGLERPDGSALTATLNRGSYTINPVIKFSTITTAAGKKVGYFAFSRFTTLNNAQPKIDEAFTRFMADGVTELVVDLRYNGGGAVETSAYLANYMVPAAKNGTTMFTEYYNATLQNNIYPLLAKKYRIDAGDFSTANNTFRFTKKGTLALTRVFFLVSGNTASASELLINNLKPALPAGVQIIGRTTYGKPVGFFAIPLGNRSQYDLYLSEFESRNSEGKADFYQGMIPGDNFAGVIADDDVTKDFGDPNEAMLKRAVNFIDKGNYVVAGLRTQSLTGNEEAGKLRQVNQLIDVNQQFSGAVHEARLHRIH